MRLDVEIPKAVRWMSCSRDCAQPASPRRWQSGRSRAALAARTQARRAVHAPRQGRGCSAAIDQRLKAIEDRLLRMETEQTQIVTEARSAATAASTAVAGAVISDAVTRITRLEGRADQLEQRRLREE